MDIRTKLVFALVGTALASMLTLGTFGYLETRELVRETSIAQLEALAESRVRDLDTVLEGWRERVGLIASRDQLRLDLASLDPTGSRSSPERIARRLYDARVSAPSIASLAVYDRGRELAAESRVPGSPPPDSLLPEVAAGIDPGSPVLFDMTVGPRGVSTVRYLARLEQPGEGPIGWLAATLDGDDLTEVAEDTTGLGRSGETLIVADRDGSVQVLARPRRSATGVQDRRPEGALDPVRLAVTGVDSTVYEGAYDDRNRAVWAVTRYLEEPGWGLVVKVDAAEQREPVELLRDRMARLALSLGAFAILAGVLLGLHLASPIHDLAEVANRIREGETHVRATIHHEDEVGMLARTFNRMADTLTRGHLTLAAEAEEADETGEKDGAA